MGQGYSRGAAVEAGILESKDMDRALITGSAQEGRVMAEVDTVRQTGKSPRYVPWGHRPTMHTLLSAHQ